MRFPLPERPCALPVLRPPRSGRARGAAFGRTVARTPPFFDHDLPLRLTETPADPDLRVPKVGTFRVLPFAHKSHPDFIYFI